MKLIPLSQGKFAMVDDTDFERVNQFKWYALKYGQNFYARRNIRKPNGKRSYQSLHQFLLPGVARIDHRDGNSLNDQMENLRPATRQQNGRGVCHKKKGATSKFRGVTWIKALKKWMARLWVNGKNLYLGLFTEETDAARAYDAAARKYYTDGFQQLNFP